MATSKRDEIILACSECGEHNYLGTRNKRTHPDKIELKKYCSRCRKMTVHKEIKKLK